MNPLLNLAISVSRMRFWIYTGGTYVVGYVIGMENWLAFFRPEYTLYLLYFFFPANILIYGINDYWDWETDRTNPKKDQREHRVSDEERHDLRTVLLAVGGVSLLFLFFQDLTALAIFIAFLFLAYFYSAPPLRFKRIPFLDFSSNMLYIMPGIFGYYLAAGTLPPLIFVAAGYLHIAAMHLFSAIPDIEYDQRAGINTTAVLLGRSASLSLCLLFWSLFALLVVWLADCFPLSFLAFLYPFLPLSLLFNRKFHIDQVYWRLPLLNTALGGLTFAVFFLLKFPLPVAAL